MTADSGAGSPGASVPAGGGDALGLNRIELLLDAHRPDEALRVLGPRLAQAPHDVQLLTLLGRIQAQRQDHEAMLQVANALVAVHPDGFFGHLLASEALFALKQYHSALHAAQRAVQQAPELDVCHRMVAWTASEVPGSQAVAWAAARHAVALDPLDADNHTCMGTIAMEQGDHQVAERAFAEALRLNPGDANARHNLGVMRSRQGRLADAAEDLLASAALDPHHDLLTRNLTAVVHQWMRRTHYGLVGLWLVMLIVTLSSPRGWDPWARLGVLVLSLAVGVWWTRLTLQRLGAGARGVIWRVVHRGATALRFWLMAAVVVMLVIGGVVPDPTLSLIVLRLTQYVIMISVAVSWTALARRRRS
ncbi:MAG: tetratricopeptide repeat protein [Kineosporiaceae bacterium]|nr:tetratricopeptide repeat protein [Kineosporiaceae bacterium]